MSFDQDGVRTMGLVPSGWETDAMVSAMAFVAAPVPALSPGIHLDVSHHDFATFDALCMERSGVESLYMGWLDPAKSEEMCRRAKSARLPLDAHYAFLYFGRSSTQPERVTERIIMAAKDHGGLPCLDLEADDREAPPVNITQRNAQLERCARMVDEAGFGYALGYTAPWWAGNGTASSGKHGAYTGLADRGWGLWYPNYGRNDGTLRPIRAVRVMGWTHCVIHQYWSTGPLCGRPVRDWNYEFEDAFASKGGLSVDDRQRLDRLERIIAANGIDLDTIDGPVRVAGEKALEEADRRGWSAFLGIKLARDAIAEHSLEPHIKAAGGDVADHEHLGGGVKR